MRWPGRDSRLRSSLARTNCARSDALKLKYRFIQRFEIQAAGPETYDVFLRASRIPLGKYHEPKARKKRFRDNKDQNKGDQIGGGEVRGFKNAGEISERAGNLKNRIARQGYPDAKVGIRGSSVEGMSTRKGTEFRWEGKDASDVDFFFTSEKLEMEIDKLERSIGPLWQEGRLRPEALLRAKPELAAMVDEFGRETAQQIGRKADGLLLKRSLIDSLDKAEYVILR